MFVYAFIHTYIYTAELPYFEVIGNKLKLSWLQTFPYLELSV